MAEVEWETESEDEAQEQAPPIVVKTEPTIKTEPETKSVSTSAPIVEKKKVDAEAVRKVRRDMLDYYKRTDEAERLALQLRTGYVSILGGRTRLELYKTARFISRLAKTSMACPDAKVCNFNVNNIVVVCETTTRFRLEILLKQLQKLHFTAKFEQEIFNALLVKLGPPQVPAPVSCKVFHTGALIFMGSVSIADVVDTINYLYPLLVRLSRQAFEQVETFGDFTVNTEARMAAMEELESAGAASSAAAISAAATSAVVSSLPSSLSSSTSTSTSTAATQVKVEQASNGSVVKRIKREPGTRGADGDDKTGGEDMEGVAEDYTLEHTFIEEE